MCVYGKIDPTDEIKKTGLICLTTNESIKVAGFESTIACFWCYCTWTVLFKILWTVKSKPHFIDLFPGKWHKFWQAENPKSSLSARNRTWSAKNSHEYMLYKVISLLMEGNFDYLETWVNANLKFTLQIISSFRFCFWYFQYICNRKNCIHCVRSSAHRWFGHYV